MKKRILWIDQLKGLTFIFVIIGHLGIGKALKSWIYSFHMPLFFFISGFTLNIEKIYKTPFLDYLKKISKRMLVPYFWIFLVMYPIAFIRRTFILHKDFLLKENIIGMFLGNHLAGDYPVVAGPLYFLLIMYLSQIIIWVLTKTAKGKITEMFVFSLLLLPLSLFTSNIDLPWHINTVPAAVFMIIIGKIIMNFYISHKSFFNTSSPVIYILTVAVLFAIGTLLWKFNGRVSLDGNSYGKNFALCILSAVSTGFAFAMIIMKLPKSRILTFIGQNTLFYMGVHAEIIRYLNALFPNLKNNPWFIAAETVFISLILIPITMLIQKFQPYITGVPIKNNTLSIEIGKYVAITVATVIPFVFALKAIESYFYYYSYAALLVLSIAVYLALCTLFTRFADKYLPFIFLQDKHVNSQ